MKKFLIIISIFLFSVVSFSQQLNLSIDKINSGDLKIGDTTKVNINVKKTQFPISSFQLYLEYNSDVLKYINTSFINDIIFKGWTDNQTDKYFAGVFIAFSKDGIFIEEDLTLLELSFIYLGGETDIKWCNGDISINGDTKKVETLFFQPNSEVLESNLQNGCVCNHK
jgi:hypothetical protein